MPPESGPSLAELEVLILDCQATAAAPLGHLLEIGWATRTRNSVPVRSRLVALPPGERIPPAVARITGISEAMLSAAVDAAAAWNAVLREAAALDQPAPTVIHFASFERKFLDRLSPGSGHLDIVCTHDIARRLLPDLPRRSLRALAGYFGRSVGPLRRSAEHVEATGFVWSELVALLERERVTTWSGLRCWLSTPYHAGKRTRRVWPMPREARLAAPAQPGIYRMLRTSGDVLYVGKATSLRDRVNSHFRHQHGVHERGLEMLSQARAISFTVTPTALEAALLETDEIKRHRPPYNVALQDGNRELWFASADLCARRSRPAPDFPLGPFPSTEPLDEFAALTGGDPAAATQALGLGTTLWRQGRRDTPVEPLAETAEAMREAIAIRAALARRRASWVTSLMDASLVWREPGASTTRVLLIELGEIVRCEECDGDAAVPIPPGHRRDTACRHAAMTVARFDRLRIITTELKRLAAAGACASLRFGARPPLCGPRLAAALAWL